MSSYAAPQAQQQGAPRAGTGGAAAPRGRAGITTTTGKLYDQGVGGLVDLGNKFKGNEAVNSMVTGSLADIYRTQANSAAALQYNDAFLGSLSRYQTGMETLRTGNTMTLMAGEGRITKEIMSHQTDEKQRGLDREGARANQTGQRFFR